MPFARKTLTELRTEIAQDIGADTLLRFSPLRIIANALAGMINLLYGYLDWIASQAVPYMAEQEFLEGWAAFKRVYREAATSATGGVTFTGTPGAVIASGAEILRDDGVSAQVVGTFTVGSGGTVEVSATVAQDPAGLTGAFGNCDVGRAFTLSQAIDGIQSSGVVTTAFTGGADLESDDSLRARMLEVFQNPPQGGASTDYVEWAKAVAGVTRAWCEPLYMGSGTVAVFIMLDVAQAAHGGFPQGTNGGATDEMRIAAATGDQLTVANYIYTVQPVTPVVYVLAPASHSVNFSIAGIPTASQSLAQSAIDDVFLRDGAPAGTIAIASIWAAISAVSGVSDFVITSPTGDIVCPAGSLPVRGTVTWS